MKTLLTGSITATAGMPLKSGSVEHIQSNVQEGIQTTAIPIIGSQYNTTDFFVMHGCVNSTPAGPAFTISAGAIYKNDEWYLVDAVTFTPGGGQTAIGTITETFFLATPNADPTVFTDATSHNVNSIKKIVFHSGVAGTSDVDFADLKLTGWGPKHLVGASGEPSFSSGWGNKTGWSPLSFRRNYSTNQVYVEGIIEKASWDGSVSNLFMFPSGDYIPSSPGVSVNCVIYASTTTTSYVGTFNINVSTGNVSVQLNSTIAATTVTLSIFGINYLTF